MATRSLITISAALAIALAGAPAEAGADSIVYIKGGDLWRADGDGKPRKRLTREGTLRRPYYSPSQANDGTIVAQRGTRFFRFSRSGRRLGSIASLMTGKPAGINAVGPFDPRVSPNGRTIVYWLGIYSNWRDARSGEIFTSPGSVVVWQAVKSGRFLGATQFYEEPSWVGNSQVLMFDPNNVLTANAVVGRIGGSHNDLLQWFHDDTTKLPSEPYWKPIGAGELNGRANRLALLRGGTNAGDGGRVHGAANTIAIYSTSGFGSPPVMWPCAIVDAVGGEFGAPTWSPRGDALAWAEGNGVWSTRVGSDCRSLRPRLLIRGGREPDWGPANG